MALYKNKVDYMKFFTKLLTLLTLTFVGLNANAQNISNKGRDFWAGYGHHHFFENVQSLNEQNMTLYLSVEDLPAGKAYATVTVEVDSSGLNSSLFWRRVYHIPANTVYNITKNSAFSASNVQTGLLGPIPKGGAYDFRLFDDNCPLGTGGFGSFKRKGIHITSDVDIVAYANIYANTSTGATMLLPTPSWGYSYTTINSKQVGYDHCYSWFYVVAQENNTRVKITGAAAPRFQANCAFVPPTAGVPFTVNLQKGEIFQYVGQADVSGIPAVELTGSKVESIPDNFGYCHKIAVFAGSSRTSGETPTNSSKDNDMQQCFPEHTWGKRYATVPWATASNSNINACASASTAYKVMAKEAGTTIKINNTGPFAVPISPIGSVYRFSSSAPSYIESNKPIMVAQFMLSSNGGGDGDPEMVYLSPLEQAISKVGFYRQDSTNINSNFISVVVPDSGLATLEINNFKNSTTPPFGANACVKNFGASLPGYKIVIKGWTSANEQVFVKCKARFNVITYGLGGAESYGYSGGAFFNSLAVKPDPTTNINDINIISQAGIDTLNHGRVFDSSVVDMKGTASFAARRLDWLYSLMDTTKVTIKRQCDGVKNKDYSDSMSGGYIYYPINNFTGYDTFYMRGCDANTNNCQYQMHIMKIGTPFTIKSGPIKKIVTINQTIGGNATPEFGATGGRTLYYYNNINAPLNKSTRGGTARVTNITTGLYFYTPPLNYVGLDTFYFQVCDNSTPTNCLSQMYIVTVGTQFTASNVTIKNGTTVNTAITDSATVEIAAVGGLAPYKYRIVDALGNIVTNSYAGGTVTIDTTTGIYTYTPANGFSGTDTFYVKLYDALATPFAANYVIELHNLQH